VTLRFHGDRPPLAASLLVGCDGGQSAVRAQLLGDDPPTFAGS
jgi:2-polyprenyl-6-methoxyphenol hydroxylase-like FAD-dependent oxidoreductase